MSDLFDEVCPYYLSIGMTYEQFWFGNPEIATQYQKAEQIRRDRRNQDMWLQYLYGFRALCDVAPLLHAFSKNAKVKPSLDEPFPLTLQQIQEQEQREYQAKIQRMKEQAAAINSRRKMPRPD